MGGGRKYPFPTHVWSPAGGWWGRWVLDWFIDLLIYWFDCFYLCNIIYGLYVIFVVLVSLQGGLRTACDLVCNAKLVCKINSLFINRNAYLLIIYRNCAALLAMLPIISVWCLLCYMLICFCVLCCIFHSLSILQ